MRVAVLSGGRSSEHEISRRSGEAVAAGLRQADHEPVEIEITRDGQWRTAQGTVELSPARGLLDCDVAFPVLHGPFGEDGSIQGLLEHLDLPYVGPGVLAAATTMDKLTCKRLLARAGVPQVEFCEVGESGWRERAEGLGSPVWVKPSRLGSSLGITRVEDPTQLEHAIAEAGRFDPRVIIEADGGGREIECSVLGNEQPFASTPGEIVTDGEWYDFEAKYEAGGMRLEVPARLDEGTIARVRELAGEVFAICDCSGLARCDFFVTGEGEVLVNEINTIPGFTETSVYAKLLEADGIEYPALCDRLLQLAVERHRRERQVSY